MLRVVAVDVDPVAVVVVVAADKVTVNIKPKPLSIMKRVKPTMVAEVVVAATDVAVVKTASGSMFRKALAVKTVVVVNVASTQRAASRRARHHAKTVMVKTKNAPA